MTNTICGTDEQIFYMYVALTSTLMTFALTSGRTDALTSGCTFICRTKLAPPKNQVSNIYHLRLYRQIRGAILVRIKHYSYPNTLKLGYNKLPDQFARYKRGL